jgi:hypothetical protein
LKWLWIVTLSNVVATGFLILIILATLQVIGIAAYVTTWPMFALLPVVLTLSIIGLKLARKNPSKTARWTGYLLNGCALAVPAVVAALVGTLFVSATKEKYIIPSAYEGEIYVVHDVANGQPPEKSFWGTTYRIPKDGVLLTQAPMSHNFTRTTYYSELKDGSLRRIRSEWYSTIERTPENLANDRDIGMYFPRTGSFTDAAGCRIEYDEIYVGTKADILSNPRELDLSSYLRSHPAVCQASAK